MASSVTRRYHGMTRVGVCVVLFIVALLAALIIPAIQHARESARRDLCLNTQRQLALAVLNYESAQDIFPQGCTGNTKFPPEKRWSWYLVVGNYVESTGTPVIDYECSWDDPSLRPLQRNFLSKEESGPREYDIPLVGYVVKCPNGTQETHTDGQLFTDYVGTAGIGPAAAILPRDSELAGVWSYDEGCTLEDIRDGSSTTMLVIETANNNGCWLAGGPATVREYLPEQHSIGPGRQFGGLHNGGCVAGFVDGHARFLPETIAPEVLSGLITIAGSEDVSSAAFEVR